MILQINIHGFVFYQRICSSETACYEISEVDWNVSLKTNLKILNFD